MADEKEALELLEKEAKEFDKVRHHSQSAHANPLEADLTGQDSEIDRSCPRPHHSFTRPRS